RLDTDILGANRAEMASALVLTGIDGPKQVLAAERDARPTYLLEDLRGLFQPYPAPTETVERRTGDRVVTVGQASVRVAGRAVRADRGDGIDLLRAGAAAIWDAGVPIHALEVDPRIYSQG